MASTDPAQPDASSAALIPLGSHAKNAAIELKRPITVIGSRKDIVRLHLESSTVSKAHAVVVLNSWGCYVADLGSRTGTLVNGQPVADQDLNDGDVLQIGRFQFKYRAPRHTKSKRRPLDPADLVSSAAPTPAFLNKRVSVIGRRAGADVAFESSQVSNIHALIVEQDGRRVLRDMNSRTGTWLDGKPIHQEILPPGAAFKVGGATLTIAPRPEILGRPDEPLTLAEAGPFLAAGLDAPAETVALDAVDLLPTPAAAPADDDLAALRREWKAPGRQEADAAGPESAEAALAEDELALESPAHAEAKADALPLVEAEPDVADLAPVDAPTTPAADDVLALEPAEAAEPEIDLAHQPLDVAEAPAEPAEAAVSPAAETPSAELDLDDIELDEPEIEATPAAEAPLEIEVDDREPARPAAEVAPVAAEAPAAETPLDVDDIALEDEPETPAATDIAAEAPTETTAEPDLDVLAEPAATAEAPVDDAPDLKPEPVTVEPLPVAERPNLDAIAEPPDFSPTAETPAAETVASELDELEELDLSEVEAELLADDVVTAEPDESAIVKSVFVDEPVAEKPESLDLDVLAEPAAEAETPVDDTPDVKPAPVAVAPLPETERPALDVLAEAPAAPEAAAEDDEAEDTEPVAAVAEANESPVVLSEAAVVVPADEDEELDIEPLALEPLDLGDLVVTRDPDAPALPSEAAAAESDEAVADVDGLMLDVDAPAPGSDVTAVAVPPIGLESPAAADEEADSIDLALPTEATAEVAADEKPADEADLALEPLDLDDLELDLDAPKPGTAVDAELDALMLDTDAPAEEVDGTPVISGRQTVSDTPAVVSDTPATDQIDLAADEAEDEAVEAARDPMNHVALESAIADPLAPEAASAATIIDRLSIDPVAPPETPAAEAPAEPEADDDAPIEPDHIRLAEDVDDEANEATALAVDLGLILDEEPHDTVQAAEVSPVPGPEAPVDIDLSGPTLSGLGGMDTLTSAATPGAAFIDADHVEPSAPLAPAAEAPAAEDDHIEPPKGGSLADLIPGGPPILGGSFMSMPPSLPSLPPAPRRTPPAPAGPGGKRRPLRVGFGGETAKPNAPFAAERTISDAAGASAFVADDTPPSASSASAFGGIPAAPVPAASTPAAPPADAALPAERFRPRGVIRPVVPGGPPVEPLPQTTAGVTPAAVYSAENELLRARKHKLRVRRVITCLVAMIVLTGGAVAGVYHFVPLKSSVEALITFNGLDGLGVEDRTNFQIRQNQALLSENVRTAAVTNLPPAIADPGFLANGKTIYDAVTDDPKIRWPAGQSIMRLQVRTTDRTNDLYRVRALAEALVKATEPDAKRRNDLLAEAADYKSKSDAYRRQMTDLSDQIQALEQAALNRPVVRNTSDLNAEYLAAEPALTSIKSQRQELEATVERLSKPVTKDVGAANVDATAADEELTKLSVQLAELQQATTRPANNDADARKKLDESIAQLEKNLADAQKLRDNPQLTAYVESASRLFKQMREMTESLMRRQETTRTQLGELKARMSDNLQALTQDRLAKDTDLKKLRDSLAITERQHNAAVASGFTEEAKKLELQLRLLKVKVAERQDQFQNDSVYSPSIAQLQKIIDSQEGNIKADRKDIDDRLTALQGDFLKNAPAVEKLPAEQKQLAEGIEAKMKAMNDARRQYAQASEAAAAAQAKAEAESREKVNALRVQIAARRQDVLTAAAAKQAQDDEQSRVRDLAAAQAKLADVRLAEQKAAHRLTDASVAIEKNEQQRRINATADTDLSAKRRERDDVEKKLRDVQTEARTREAQIARLIVPDRKVDTLQDDDKDRRPLLAGSIGGGIAVLLLIPILLDLLALSREAHGYDQPDLVVADAADGFEPVLPDTTGEHTEQKALPQPAHVG